MHHLTLQVIMKKKKKQNILYISNLQGTADPQHRAKNTFPNIIE